MVDLASLKKVHIVGIGGIGISAIAHMLLEGNPKIGLAPCVISGSDAALSLVTENLEKAGARIFHGHRGDQVPEDVGLVLYTVAIPDTNPELARAKELGIPCVTYPEMLRAVSKDFYTIAVSGTHGKTTTTAMLGKILVEAGLDPTVIVGSLLRHGTNFILGKSKYLVVEADEYRKSFHNLTPSLLVITNIDEDHLDFYKDLTDIQNAFADLVRRLPEDGYLVCDSKDPHVNLVASSANSGVVDYASFEIGKLAVFGMHNRKNAQAAGAAAHALGVSKESIMKSLETFEGTWRRFEYRGTMKTGALVYDDYAHNPQKVRAALQGAREAFPDKKIVAVFGPHLFSRTKLLLKDFGKSFGDADRIIVADIYAAREAPDDSIHARDLAHEIRENGGDAHYLGNFEAIKKDLEETTDEETVVILMGAGDIYELGAPLTQQ